MEEIVKILQNQKYVVKHDGFESYFESLEKALKEVKKLELTKVHHLEIKVVKISTIEEQKVVYKVNISNGGEE